MEDQVHKARAILTVYLERGRAALEAFAAQRDEDGAECLRLRAAAYHNFCALDQAALDAGHNLVADPELCNLERAARADAPALAAALTEAKARAIHQQQRLRDARRALGGYLTGPEHTGKTITHTA